jgi:hypothetical protein
MAKRRDGILYYEVKCKDIPKVKLPIFFSFNLEKEEEGSFLASSFSPPGILKLLTQREFFILKDEFGSHLIKAKVKKVIGENRCRLELLQEVLTDNRIYDRFNFCPEEFGEFELRKEREVISRAKILDISLSGVKLLLQKQVNLTVGEYLLMNQGTKILNLQVIRTSQEKKKFIVGAKIISTNFNLINFIIGHYVKLVKELLSH